MAVRQRPALARGPRPRADTSDHRALGVHPGRGHDGERQVPDCGVLGVPHGRRLLTDRGRPGARSWRGEGVLRGPPERPAAREHPGGVVPHSASL